MFGSLTLAGQGRRYLTEKYNTRQIARGHLDPSYRYDVSRMARMMDGPAYWEDITVPVVFHILWYEGADRVSEAQILAQLASLNADFAGEAISDTEAERDIDGRFASGRADTKISFCFPAAGSLGEAYSGPIQYRQIDSVFDNGLNRIKGVDMGIDATNPRRCLNIWVTPLRGNIAGFAQFPGGRAGKDGIVIDPAYFLGSDSVIRKFNGGKTLTHLVGNYLGLRPLWTDRQCTDDGIADTPVHNLPNRGRSGAGHVSLCDGNPLEMTMNFMDSGRDSELSMFTEGQARWMRAVLDREGPRSRVARTAVECNYTPTAKSFAGKPLNTDSKLSSEAGPPRVYPNPTNGFTRVELSGAARSIHELVVFDVEGKEMYRLPRTGGVAQLDIDVSTWPKGVYFLQLLDSEGDAFTKKITVL